MKQNKQTEEGAKDKLGEIRRGHVVESCGHMEHFGLHLRTMRCFRCWLMAYKQGMGAMRFVFLEGHAKGLRWCPEGLEKEGGRRRSWSSRASVWSLLGDRHCFGLGRWYEAEQGGWSVSLWILGSSGRDTRDRCSNGMSSQRSVHIREKKCSWTQTGGGLLSHLVCVGRAAGGDVFTVFKEAREEGRSVLQGDQAVQQRSVLQGDRALQQLQQTGRGQPGAGPAAGIPRGWGVDTGREGAETGRGGSELPTG